MTQFDGVLANAANITQSASVYTSAMFLADFPQFTNAEGTTLVPSAILEQFISMACQCISPDRWFEQWRYACGLYTAHCCTLYLRTYSPHSANPAQAAASGALVGVVKSATLGDSSVSYDTDALTKATEKWGGLNATQYGQLLATQARMAGMGGTLVM